MKGFCLIVGLVALMFCLPIANIAADDNYKQSQQSQITAPAPDDAATVQERLSKMDKLYGDERQKTRLPSLSKQQLNGVMMTNNGGGGGGLNSRVVRQRQVIRPPFRLFRR